MDILRKELNALYASQHLEYEHLDEAVLHDCQTKIASMAAVSNACYVITDASADTCFIHAGWLGRLLGLCNDARFYTEHYTEEIRPLTLGERRHQVLNDREKEILRLIREGRSSKQIADALNISIHTVNRHRQNILEKLSVGNSHEAITAASAMRLL